MELARFGEDGGPDVPDLTDLKGPVSEMRDIVARYEADRDSLKRKYPSGLPALRQSRMRRFYTGWLAALQRMDFDSLRHSDRIDALLFDNHLRYALRRLELEERRYAEMAPLLPFAPAILGLEEERLRMEWVEPARAADRLHSIAAQIEATRQSIDAELGSAGEPWKPALANRTAETAKGLRETLKRWYTFYQGYDPLFTWWAEVPYREVDAALERYANFLRERVVGVKPGDHAAIVGDPIGREALLAELAFEMIPYTPEELIAIGEQELAWCEEKMKQAARDLGYGEDRHAALEHVKTLHQEPGRQPEMIRELALEAIAFLEERDLVTIPPLARETWRMEMMTPEQQRINPFFLGGETIHVSFPTCTMTHAEKQMSMRGNNRPFARATVQHELIPGHHLQGYMMERYRPYRRVFRTVFWIEGWALYWEMRLWDLGFAQSPENRIGMLFWRMHRCARILFSLGFHLEQRTPEECIALLVDRVGHERANATAEVRRSFNGDYVPLYQCAYLLGGLQIRALHRERVESGAMTERAFHDAILQENAIPIEMLRAALTGQHLDRDFTSCWRFYGPAPHSKAS